jgi:hypothetical protein
MPSRNPLTYPVEADSCPSLGANSGRYGREPLSDQPPHTARWDRGGWDLQYDCRYVQRMWRVGPPWRSLAHALLEVEGWAINSQHSSGLHATSMEVWAKLQEGQTLPLATAKPLLLDHLRFLSGHSAGCLECLYYTAKSGAAALLGTYRLAISPEYCY